MLNNHEGFKGTGFNKELWGVDDHATVDSIWRVCYRRSTSVRAVLVAAMVCGACNGLICGILMTLLRLHGWRLLSAQSLALGLTLYLVHLCRKHRAARLLPEVLRSMGRCARCGYRLDDHGANPCPECGQPAARAQTEEKGTGAVSATERHSGE